MVRCVRERDGCSRVELARELKLAPSTAGIYVDRLVRTAAGWRIAERVEERSYDFNVPARFKSFSE